VIRLFVFYIFLVFSNNIWADCDDALRKCKSQCDSDISVQGETLISYITDFESNCEDACKKGLRECEDTKGSMYDKCDGFKRKCKRTCPNSVYIYSNSKGVSTGYTYSSNAESVCEDACTAGYRRCE
jgi:hypothetical protein